MTDDEEIRKEAQLRNDESLYGFSVVDMSTGERVDPRSVKPVAGERYGLYGVIAEEYEVNKPEDFDKQGASDSGDALIYETDDREEAKAIYLAGGFTRDNHWHVVTRVEDREKQLTMRQTHRMPDKRDFDQ